MLNTDRSARDACDEARFEAPRPRAGSDPSQLHSRLLEPAIVAGLQTAEMGSYAATLLEIQLDRARASARRRIASTAAAALGLLVLAAALVAASVRFVAGLSGAFAELFGGLEWAGDLAAGAVSLVGLALGAMLAWTVARRVQLRRAETKYAERRRRHAQRFGARHGQPAASTAN